MDGEGGGSGSETEKEGAGKGGESEKGESEAGTCLAGSKPQGESIATFVAAEFSYDFFADYNARLTEEEKARGGRTRSSLNRNSFSFCLLVKTDHGFLHLHGISEVIINVTDLVDNKKKKKKKKKVKKTTKK